MSNTFEEDASKIYHESTYIWNLYYKNKLNNLDSSYLYSEVFPKMKRKWKGMVNIKYVEDGYRVQLRLSADHTTSVEYTLLALSRRKFRYRFVEEKRQNVTLYKNKKSEDFMDCDFITIPEKLFSKDSHYIKIKIIIREEVSAPKSTDKETNTTEEILLEYGENRIVQEINTNEILKNDFKAMFDNKEFSDFVIKLNDSNEILVHKNILSARSSVFSAMLKNDSSEKNEGYVNITDIDKNTMMLLLNFIYTGNIIPSDLSVDEAKNLLSAADKYDILDLKRICGNCLESNLEISNAIDILLLSELHSVPELKNCVVEYILNNKESFSNPVKFEKLGKKFPNLMIELFMKVFNNET